MKKKLKVKNVFQTEIATLFLCEEKRRHGNHHLHLLDIEENNIYPSNKKIDGIMKKVNDLEDQKAKLMEEIFFDYLEYKMPYI